MNWKQITSRTANASGMVLFATMVNSFYQWTIVTKISVLNVETVPPEHTGFDDKAFQRSTSSFLLLILFSFTSLYLFFIALF